MKQHDLLLQRHTGAAGERRHDGQVTVERSNTRWCSDGFEITCDNKEKVRVAFALECCDREAIAHVATTEGIKSEDVQDLVITAVENRFGRVMDLSRFISASLSLFGGYLFEQSGRYSSECRMPSAYVVKSVDVFEKRIGQLLTCLLRMSPN